MSAKSPPALIAREKQNHWSEVQPSIWSVADQAPREDLARSVMRTLFDRPRWLEAFHLYDDRGSELFERICDLPEYYLTRTENTILENSAGRIISAAPVEAIVELGAGYSKKTIHLLRNRCASAAREFLRPSM